jgi:hypothetical protein
LLPNQKKELQIVPLLNRDIAGVIKVNYIDPERLVLVKNDDANHCYGNFGLYLFKK